MLSSGGMPFNPLAAGQTGQTADVRQRPWRSKLLAYYRLKVVGIPARAFERNHRRELLVHLRSAANGTLGRGVRHFLQHILGVATSGAFVGVNGHGVRGKNPQETSPAL